MTAFDDPALAGVVQAIAIRLERNGLQPGGRLRVDGLDAAARFALGGLLGRVVTGTSAWVDLGELDGVARVRSGCAGGLVHACSETLGRPLVDRRARRAERAEARSRPVSRLLELSDDEHPWVVSWVEEVSRLGLLTRSADPDRTALDAVAVVSARLDGSQQPLSRSELAAGVVGDAHALDDGTILAAIVLRGLARCAGLPYPREPTARRDLWQTYGVGSDRVSSTVLTVGLRVLGETRLSSWLAGAADARAPVHLTQRDVDELGQHRFVPGAVLVCENPRVLEAAAEGGYGSVVICVMGRPNGVVLTLLDRLAADGVRLRYHGDFDWAGVAIAAAVAQRSAAVPWQMGADDYLHAVAAGRARLPLTGSPVATPWDEALSGVMEEHGVTVHEELLLPELIRQWASEGVDP